MQYFKRISLFFLVNIAIITVLMFIVNLLGIGGYRTAQGIDYSTLALFSLVWGMAGSFISLAISKKMAKWTMGLKIIDSESSRDMGSQQLLNTVHSLARNAGLSKMPEVAIYESEEVNAFATGPSKNNSLVAVSTGLLSRMTKEEIEGVLGHEVAHIANGDMVTMTLIQGVMNAFVIFFAKAIAWAAANFLKGDDDEGPSFFLAFAIEMALTIVFGLLASIVVSAFSRYREFRADQGGSDLAGREKMIAALERLKGTVDLVDNRQESLSSMKISGRGRFVQIFSTHPPLEVRIQRLRAAK